jgi:beta-lactamase regulating signal transducer with metallopeptidase domain
MMQLVFEKILWMSLSGTLGIFCVLICRVLLKGIPNRYSYLLWGIVLYRLLCPVAVWAPLSPYLQSAIPAVLTDEAQITPVVGGQSPHFTEPLTQMISNRFSGESTIMLQINPWVQLLYIVWLVGTLVFLAHGAYAALRLRQRVQSAAMVSANPLIYALPGIETPFVFGVLRSAIYIPAELDLADSQAVIWHERIHIKRNDPIFRMIGYVALSLHWFNPFVWLAYRISEVDMEMACDEAVIEQFGERIKPFYASTLLATVSARPSGVLGFGKGDMEYRIKHILHYQKPKRTGLIAGVIICIIAAGSIVMLTQRETSALPSDVWVPSTGMISNDIDIAKLLANQTAYVGDNSKVGGILGELSMPESLTYGGFSLHTSEMPYGVTIYFTTQDDVYLKMLGDDAATIGDDAVSMSFKRNAALLLSLVDNAEWVRYQITSPSEMQDYTFDRTWADELFRCDIRLFAESADSFANLVNLMTGSLTDKAISDALLMHFSERDGRFQTGSGKPIQTIAYTKVETSITDQSSLSEVTVDTIAMYCVFTEEMGRLDAQQTVALPAAITLKAGENGSYEVVRIDVGEAIAQDLSACQLSNTIACYAQAIRASDLTSNEIVGWITALIAEIESSPAYSSAPSAYIEAHRPAYNELVYLGRETLTYGFTAFEGNALNGLNGHIVAIASKDILPAIGEGITGDVLYETGDDWYTAYKAITLNRWESMADQTAFEAVYPGGAILMKTFQSP